MKSAAVLIAAAAMLLPLAAVKGEEGAYFKRVVGFASDGSPRYARFYCRGGHCVPAHRALRHAGHDRGARVYSYIRRADEAACSELRRVVGDQHLTIDGAKKSANDAWAGAVRFHLGEKYMDLSHAKHVIYTCSRSSIKEGGVTTLGQTLTRCEIEAQPCPAPREDGETR